MTINFTTEMKSRLLRFLSDGMEAEDVAEEFGCETAHIVAIARNHGYPDREKLARAAGIIEENLRTGKVAPPPVPVAAAKEPPARQVEQLPDGQPARLGDLLAVARQHPSKRIQSTAAQIVDRIQKLRDLISEDDKKHAEKRRQQAKRDAARAEVQLLQQQLADARARLRPTTTATAATGAPSDDLPSSVIRAWALAAGVDCPKSGRVPATVRNAYLEAHNQEVSTA